MDEADLVKIRGALERETLPEACREMERVLLAMGYYLAVPHKPIPYRQYDKWKEREAECSGQ